MKDDKKIADMTYRSRMADPTADEARKWTIHHDFGSSGISGPDTSKVCVVEMSRLEQAKARIAELEAMVTELQNEVNYLYDITYE